MKPPTASREDIENSGLQIIKAYELPRYQEEGKVASNCVDRVSHLTCAIPVSVLTRFAQCLVCLDGYQLDSEIRVMSCRHAFHKECIDKWLTVGRNNCPACRTKVSRVLVQLEVRFSRPFRVSVSSATHPQHHLSQRLLHEPSFKICFAAFLYLPPSTYFFAPQTDACQSVLHFALLCYLLDYTSRTLSFSLFSPLASLVAVVEIASHRARVASPTTLSDSPFTSSSRSLRSIANPLPVLYIVLTDPITYPILRVPLTVPHDFCHT